LEADAARLAAGSYIIPCYIFNLRVGTSPLGRLSHNVTLSHHKSAKHVHHASTMSTTENATETSL
jgi:hypothetical protein